MKRTSKILILVLSLALVFAAVATVVSATAEDINVKKNVKFDSAAPGLVGTASDTKNPSVEGVTFQQGKRAGKVEIVEGADGNQYALITQTDKVGTSGPYASLGTGGNASVTDGVLSVGDNDISNYKLYLFEVDVMSPTGKFPAGGSLDPGARAFKANATARDFWNTNATQNIVKFGNDADGAYLYSDAYEGKLYVNPYEFTKISIVVENTTKEGDANIGVTSHIFVNGELWFSKVATNVPTSYHSDTPHAAFIEFRVNYTLVDDPTQTIAIDNMKYATVPAGSETAVADLIDYDKARMPLGLPVAQVGEVKFDNMDLALAAVAEGETLKLLANVATPFEVDKLIFIDTNGFTADVRPADGYALQETEAGIYKVISSAGRTVEVFWDECLHEETCEDNYDAMHPLAYFDELAIGEKFYAAYNPTYNGLIGDDGKYYQLVGWKNIATDEVIALDAAVTEADVAEGFVFLEPVYEITVKNFEYVKGGKLQVALEGEMTLAEVIKAADAGSTIKLFSDINVGNVRIDIGKKLTLDVNGYTIKALVEGSKAKTSLFRMTGGTDFTVTSSRFGGKIFNEGWNSATGVGAAGMFNWPNDTAILRINGNIDGKPALSIYTGNVVQGYSNACEYHIDGGMFVCMQGDQQGLFDSRKAGQDASIENAFFYVPGASGVVAYPGRNTETDQDHKVIMDNCVIIGNAVSSIVAPVEMTMTNCYVTGTVNAVLSATYKTVTDGATKGQPNKDGLVILGDGNYIGGKISGNVQYADGVKLYEVPSKFDFTYFTHTWKASADYTFDPSSFNVSEVTASFAFNKITTDKDVKLVNVIWKNTAGEVIGESVALSGMEAVAPANLKVGGTLIPGWLDYVPAEWNESLVVPEGVDEYVITAKEGGKVVPVAAVELYFNIRLNTHFEYRVYVPTLAEGIELTAISFRGTDRVGKYESNYGLFTINGKEYSMVDGWPGLGSGAAAAKLDMTFTYDGQTFKVEKNVNIVDYCDYILNYEANGGVDYSDAGKALAANTANYLYNGFLALGKTTEAEAVKAIVDANADLIYTIADKDALEVPDLSAVKDYISSAALYVDSYSVYMQFNLTEAGKAAKVQLSCGATAGSKDKYPELGYILTNQTHIANLNNLYITITPAVAEGEEATPIEINFNLTDYYALLAASGANAQTLALVDAMYGYAVADADYRNVK